MDLKSFRDKYRKIFICFWVHTDNIFLLSQHISPYPLKVDLIVWNT